MLRAEHEWCRRPRLVTGLALGLVFATVPHGVAQDTTVPFAVAVWGQGNVLLPFADFDGRRWRGSWPEPVNGEPDIRPIPQIPRAWWGRSAFAPTWEIVQRDGLRRSARVTGTGAGALGSGCSINIGLKTDIAGNKDEYGSALASNRPGVIEPVRPLLSGTSDWTVVSQLLPDIYRRHEGPVWADLADDFKPDLARPLSAPVLDTAFALADERGEYVYFETSRRFATRDGQLGDEHTFVAGWLWRRSPAMPFQAVMIRAGRRDEDGKGETSFQPLGAVRHGGQQFWFALFGGYAYSGMAVLDVRRAGVRQLLTIAYPGC